MDVSARHGRAGRLCLVVLMTGMLLLSGCLGGDAASSDTVEGQSEDAFATKKNHAFTTDVLSDGTYALEVISADASGNSISSTLTFEVSAGATVAEPSGENGDDGATDDESDESSGVSNTTFQVVALIVVVLVLLAFLRVRGHEPDEDDPWA